MYMPIVFWMHQYIPSELPVARSRDECDKQFLAVLKNPVARLAVWLIRLLLFRHGDIRCFYFKIFILHI